MIIRQAKRITIDQKDDRWDRIVNLVSIDLLAISQVGEGAIAIGFELDANVATR